MAIPQPTLFCPIRGQLKIKSRTSDGLKFTEEKRRIDCVRYLLGKGYKRENFKIETTLARFGHGGKNSFRTDVVVFNRNAREFAGSPLEELRSHVLLFGEIKRDSREAVDAKEFQVKAALNFLPDTRSMGLYWDDIEQRVFYKRMHGNLQQIIEAPLSYLPDFGAPLEISQLRYNDLETQAALLPLFKRIEDAIHSHISDIAVRYELLLQLLLAKIFDEDGSKLTNAVMKLQDFTLFELPDHQVEERFNDILKRALGVYQGYLPKQISDRFEVNGALLREISKYIAPVNLLGSNPEAIQNFYMYFAKQLYKWDLAQYFTPYEVVDFIVHIINPRYGETIKDPACGSADFLVSAYRMSYPRDSKVSDRIFGADNSSNAVQISILNMLLNGDGKSNIQREDSLENVSLYADRFSILLCNPPFGIRIKEKRKSVLKFFDLGKPYNEQQTGILFAELCVRQAQAGGRVAVIVPNGYLGNKSANYVEFRKWILRHTRVACIIGFPRFTFKKSGADVSASVLILEKRSEPLSEPELTEEYPVYANLLSSVGWDIGNKQAKKIYKKDMSTGALLLDETNNPILDADFDAILDDLYSSPAIGAFPWLADGIDRASVADGWSVPITDIVSDDYYILDAKRLCRKYRELVATIKDREHFKLLDVCEPVPEGWRGKRNSEKYYYVEIGNVYENGSYETQELHGWELPNRAKHRAAVGDIFIGSVWGSVKKWFIAGQEARDGMMIVTNGFYRLKLRDSGQDLLPDLIFGLSTEFYRVQMRALATGSDGLAVVSQDDLGAIVFPKLPDEAIRQAIWDYLKLSIQGSSSLPVIQRNGIESLGSTLDISERKTNFVQV